VLPYDTLDYLFPPQYSCVEISPLILVSFWCSEDNDGFNLEDQQKVECIYDVLDCPCGRGSQRSVWLAGVVVKSVLFRSIIVVIILLDSIVVALETNVTIVSGKVWQFSANARGSGREPDLMFICSCTLVHEASFLFSQLLNRLTINDIL